MIEQASHMMHAKSTNYQCTHRPPCSSTGHKKQYDSNKKLRDEVGSIKLCQKPLWGQKGRERSPTSGATSTAGAKRLTKIRVTRDKKVQKNAAEQTAHRQPAHSTTQKKLRSQEQEGEPETDKKGEKQATRRNGAKAEAKNRREQRNVRDLFCRALHEQVSFQARGKHKIT